MMKILLYAFAFALGLGQVAQAQVQLIISLPGGGTREISNLSTPANNGSWGFGDIDTMKIRQFPAQCVLRPDDSLGCTAPTADLTDKIAIIYRGSCEFGCKSLNMQTRGAKAVIIINHSTGIVNMAGASCGLNVTIPVVMIDPGVGAELKALLCSGATVTLGTYRNVFGNNLTVNQTTGATSPPAAAYPNGFVNATGMFSFIPSIFVSNNGFRDQTNVKAKAIINMTYSPDPNVITPRTIYVDSALIALIEKADDPGDTAEIFFDPFDLFNAVTSSDRQGVYELIYSINGDSVDAAPTDNGFRYQFRITDQYFSLATLDPNTDDYAGFSALSPSVAGLAPTNRVYKFGPVMRTPASIGGSSVFLDSVRLAVSAGDTVDFTSLQINIEVFKWTDGDANGQVSDAELEQVGNGLLAFSDASEKGKYISVGIDDAITGDPGPIQLQPSTNYLILSTYRGDDIVSFSGDLGDFPYERFANVEANRVVNPVFVNRWFDGFNGTPVSAMRMDLSGTIVANKPTVKQIAVSLFPNPAREYVEVLMDKKSSASAVIQIQDMSGRVLATRMSKTEKATRISTHELSSGLYQMVIRSADGVAVKKFAVAH